MGQRISDNAPIASVISTDHLPEEIPSARSGEGLREIPNSHAIAFNTGGTTSAQGEVDPHDIQDVETLTRTANLMNLPSPSDTEVSILQKVARWAAKIIGGFVDAVTFNTAPMVVPNTRSALDQIDARFGGTPDQKTLMAHANVLRAEGKISEGQLQSLRFVGPRDASRLMNVPGSGIGPSPYTKDDVAQMRMDRVAAYVAPPEVTPDQPDEPEVDVTSATPDIPIDQFGGANATQTSETAEPAEEVVAVDASANEEPYVAPAAPEEGAAGAGQMGRAEDDVEGAGEAQPVAARRASPTRVNVFGRIENQIKSRGRFRQQSRGIRLELRQASAEYGKHGKISAETAGNIKRRAAALEEHVGLSDPMLLASLSAAVAVSAERVGNVPSEGDQVLKMKDDDQILSGLKDQLMQEPGKSKATVDLALKLSRWSIALAPRQQLPKEQATEISAMADKALGDTRTIGGYPKLERLLRQVRSFAQDRM